MGIRRFFPRPLRRHVSLVRTYRRSLQRNAKLRGEHACELSAEHLARLRVVPDRPAMLREMPEGGVCAEVGVAEGDFSREIIDLLQPAKLYLIDLWSAGSERYSDSLQKVERELAEPLASGLAEIRRGYSWDELAKLQDESLDWVYIDAAHDYASVKKDLAAARPKIKPGGWICGHDYTRWSSAGIHRWGVVEAVNEFCLEHRWEFRYLTHESHRHISYALTAMS